MKIIFGTSNKGKIEALKKILKNLKVDLEIETTKDINFDRNIIEDGTTFEENSEIKAKEIKAFCDEKGIKDRIIITDDAGVCINALNGEPGVYSARYAGENATQIESINKILEKMKDVTNMEDRSCTFVCVLTAILENGEKVVARGECKGTIAKKHGILGGLTYGPIFIPEGFDKPMSDMDEEEYAESHNHREKAMIEIIRRLKEHGHIE